MSSITCHGCHRTSQVPEDAVDDTVECPYCQRLLLVDHGSPTAHRYTPLRRRRSGHAGFLSFVLGFLALTAVVVIYVAVSGFHGGREGHVDFETYSDVIAHLKKRGLPLDWDNMGACIIVSPPGVNPYQAMEFQVNYARIWRCFSESEARQRAGDLGGVSVGRHVIDGDPKLVEEIRKRLVK
jgi:hypothetical protein